MRFYNRQHRHYCGIDRHVKTVLDSSCRVFHVVHPPPRPRDAAFFVWAEGLRLGADVFGILAKNSRVCFATVLSHSS